MEISSSYCDLPDAEGQEVHAWAQTGHYPLVLLTLGHGID